MADIEKAMAALKLIDTELFVLQDACCPDYRAKAISSLRDQTAFAIDALRDEDVEEWEAFEHSRLAGNWLVRTCHSKRVIAYGLHEHEARRIAALPRLERAARDVVDERDDGPVLGNIAPFERAVDALRAALAGALRPAPPSSRRE